MSANGLKKFIKNLNSESFEMKSVKEKKSIASMLVEVMATSGRCEQWSVIDRCTRNWTIFGHISETRGYNFMKHLEFTFLQNYPFSWVVSAVLIELNLCPRNFGSHAIVQWMKSKILWTDEAQVNLQSLLKFTYADYGQHISCPSMEDRLIK